MTIKNDKVFEKLNDDTLYSVSGGLEINKPLNTVVMGSELDAESDTESDTEQSKNTDKQHNIPSKKLPNNPFDGINKGLIH